MNFSAPRSRPSVDPRRRSRLAGATVVVLAAIALAATAVPLGDAAPPPVAAPPVAAATVAAPTAPATVSPATPTADRVPSLREDGAVPVPPSPRRSTTASPPPPLAGPRSAPVRTGSPLARSEPTRVHIPAIGVDTDLVDLGLDDQGRMEVPPGAFPAGWYTGAPTPGELGPAILAGHVDYGGVAGVFFRLRDLEPGDAVDVTREDGTTAVFRVTRVEQHAKDAFPTAEVYGDIDHAGLRLITCGGAFDRSARSYEDNIVVFAELDRGAGNS